MRRSAGIAGPYQLQAHLSACHSTAPTYQDTDWDRVVGLYDLMLSLSANPAVALNRAVAVAERDGPAAGLAALDAITGMTRSHLWHAARAETLRRLGETGQAREAWRLAAQLAPTAPERTFLARRFSEMPPP